METIKKEQISKWKEAHEEVFEISVTHPDKGKKAAYFRSANRQEFSLYLTKADKIDAAEVLARNCLLGGDRALLDEDSYFISAASQFIQLLSLKESSIKKL